MRDEFEAIGKLSSGLPILVLQEIREMAANASDRIEEGNAKLDGDLVDGKANGVLTIFLKGGDVQVYCNEGVPADFIKVYFPDGIKFEGIFPEGPGQLFMPNGSMCSGFMKNCKPFGRGTVYFDQEIVPRFEGPFVDGLLHGAVTYYDAGWNVKQIMFDKGKAIEEIN